MKWDDGLASPHLDIAGSEAQRVGVLAGPGTGKTSYGLMRRVVRLLSEGVPGERILLLWFTRVAAADLRDKIEALGVPGAESVEARTLHGYCFGLLQRDSVLSYTGRYPRILLAHETDLMLRDVGGNYGDIRERRKRLKALEAAWAREDGSAPTSSPSDPEDVAFEQAVRAWLRQHRCMTIGEVVPLAYDYVYNNPQCEERSAFDHVIVDEYQDLNRVEQALLELLAEDASLCVVGDDDQSIYSMRYANPAGIREFVSREDVENYEISVCGRCPEQILAIANSLMRQAPGRQKPDLTCRTPDVPGTVAIVQWATVEEEVSGIVASIAADIAGRGRPAGDILVLTNWKEIGIKIRTALGELGISAQSFFSEEELSTYKAQDALATLRLAVHPDDAVATRVLLGSGEATGRSDAYRRLLVAADEQDRSPQDVLQRLLDGEKIEGLSLRAITTRYRDALVRAESLRQLDVAAAIDHLLPEGDVDLADLRTTALQVSLESPDLSTLLDNIIRAITQDEVPQHPDFVRVMSLHKSKGLTSPVVYIASAVQGVLPTLPRDESQRALSVEEGRRTFYVAITRASEKLVISSTSQMTMAEAMGRGVQVNQAHIRTVGGVPVAPTIASQYMSELGARAPAPVRGTTWLATETR